MCVCVPITCNSCTCVNYSWWSQHLHSLFYRDTIMHWHSLARVEHAHNTDKCDQSSSSAIVPLSNAAYKLAISTRGHSQKQQNWQGIFNQHPQAH